MSKPRRIFDKDTPLHEVIHFRDRGAVAEGRHGHAVEAGELDDFGHGPGREPGMDQREDLSPSRPPTQLQAQLRIVHQLWLLDHGGEVAPLLAGDHRHANPPILCRFDRRDLDRTREFVKAHQRCVQPLMALHRLRHAFEQRNIDVGVPRPRCPLRPTHRPYAALCRQNGQGGVHPAHVLADPTADRHRGAVGKATESGRSTEGLQGELGRRTLLPRPTPAEVGHGHHEHSRVDGPQCTGIAACRSRVLPAAGQHHGVTPSDELGQGIAIAGVYDHALRAGTEIREQRALSPQPGRPLPVPA